MLLETVAIWCFYAKSHATYKFIDDSNNRAQRGRFLGRHICQTNCQIWSVHIHFDDICIFDTILFNQHHVYSPKSLQVSMYFLWILANSRIMILWLQFWHTYYLCRTIVTYGEQMMCFTAIMAMVFIKSLSLLRLLMGPLSETLCWCQIFFNQSVAVTIMLVLNTNYLARVSVLRLDN